ncbi:MAG TPA: 30S ribosomal protein S18 [Bdellovibrionota bacterium]|jgi:small subunit ribosomal protein S18|nr:30S ribosomal protein S18 [Bdellovibrionota bacterium]
MSEERNQDTRDENQSGRPPQGGGAPSGGKDREPRGRGFRRKVCPFLADKTIVLDYKNIRMIQRFITETGKIVPRHVSGVSAKYQRELTKHIKRARSIGLIAPLAEE